MLNINITIQADADGSFSELEQSVLDALSGASTKTLEVGEVRVTEPVKAAAEEPAAKPAPAKRTRRTKAEIEAEKKAKEEAEVEEEDEPKTLQEELEEGDEEASGEDLRQKAVEMATTLVGDGKAAQVRTALQDVGIKKVSELKDKDLAAFIKALQEG